ncbi:MAG TPA: BatD family protein [Gammaproteobacteria bacterium]
MVTRLVLALGLWLSAAVLASAQDVAVTASVDRAMPRVNESFTYILRAEGRVRGEPNVAPLEQLFEILHSSQSTQIQIVNGQAEQVAEWIFQLMPRNPGKTLIPPIEVAGRFSNPVEIEILPALADTGVPDDIFLEVDVDPETAYVQSEVVYTLRLFVGVATGRAAITPPEVTGGEAIVERLGEDRRYRATRGGRDFEVNERRYAIFPQQPGKLTIGPATFEAMVIPSRGFSRVQRYRSEPVEVEVRPAVPPPPSHPNAVWLPAKRVELHEMWSDDPPELMVGVPATRTLTIEAVGLLETQLPEIEMARTDGVRQYADQPELERNVTPDGLVATRTERYAVLPQRSGEAELPGVELPWFNVETGRWEVASLPPRSVVIAPGAPTPTPEPQVEAPRDAPPAAAPAPSAGAWPALSALLGAGWLATLLLWWRSGRAPRAAVPAAEEPPRRPANRRLLRQLRAACERGDTAEAGRTLLEWAAARFASAPPRTLGALAERLPPAVAIEVRELEAALYGPERERWDGAGLAASLGEIDAAARSDGESPRDDGLRPLYR